MRLRTSLAVMALLLWSLPAVAQVSTGTVIGTIQDESNAVLPGVTVTATSPAAPGGPAVVITDAQGQFRLTELNPGLYELTAVLPGFATYEETELRVNVAATFERNITLPLATVAETITVTGESPVVDARTTGVQTNVSQEIIDNVPTSRMGMGSYIAYLPGVSPSSYNKTAPMNVMGSDSGELSYNVDGIHTNSLNGGSWGFGEVDSYEEVNVQLLGASTEFQRAAGGVLNIVSKSGTNQYQFSAMGFWQPKDLVANHVTLPCNCPEGDTGFKFLIWRDWGMNAGGPAIKDRLWFYSGVSSRGFLFRNPGAATIPKDQRWNRFDAGIQSKVTWKINDNNTYKSSMYYEWYEYNYPEAPTQQTPLESVAWFPGDEWNFSHEVTSILSSSTVLTTRFTRHHYPYSWEGFFAASPTTPGRQDTLTGVQSGNINSQSYYVTPRRKTVEAKLNQYFGGERVNHNVRFGVQWNRSDYMRQGAWAGGIFFYDFDGQPDEAVTTGPDLQRSQIRGTAFWIEDEINIGNRVTIVPGFRYDNQSAYSPDQAKFDIQKPLVEGILVRIRRWEDTSEIISGVGTLFSQNVVSPRFGTNVKLTDDGKTILRATAGRYYNPIDHAGGGGSLYGIYPGRSTTTRLGWDPLTQDYSTIISVTEPGTNRGADPNTVGEFTDQYSVGIDRELVGNVGLHVSLVHKRADDIIGEQEINGVYGFDTHLVPDFTGGPGPDTVGVTVPTRPLLSNASDRFYQRTNIDGYFRKYTGIITQVTKRMSNNWSALVGYSYGVAKGIRSGGRDPNGFINTDGARLDPEDRPHMFKVAGVFNVPKIDMQFTANLALSDGEVFNRRVSVRLPQGRTNINLDAPGVFRNPFIQWLHVRITKNLLRAGHRRLELTAEIRNVFNESSNDAQASTTYNSPLFGLQRQFAYPRQLLFMARGYF